MTRVAIPGLAPLKVQFAPTATWSTVSPTWVEMTGVRLSDSVTFSRGRSDERASAQPGTLTLTVSNPDGNYTPGLSSGAYHPLAIRCPIRVLSGSVAAAIYDDGELYDSAELYDDFATIWTGLIDEYAPGWESGRAVVKISATDRLAALQRITLQEWETHQHLVTSPALLFPLTESAGVTTVADVGSGFTLNTLAATAVGSGGTGEVGVGALPIDSGTVAAFTPVDASNGYCFTGTATSTLTTPTTAAIGVLMNASANPAATAVMYSCQSASGHKLEVCLSTAGKAYARLLDSANGVLASATGTTTITTGAWFQAGVTLSNSAGTWSLKLYVNATQEGSTATYAGGASMPVLGYVNTIGGRSGGMYSGQISHAAYWADPTSLTTAMTDASAAITGGAGETSTARHVRICAWGGITGGTVGTGVSTLGVQQVKGTSLLDALQVVADAELAPVYTTGAGVPTLAARDQRYNAPIVITLAPTDVAPSTPFVINDRDLVNDVRGTRPGGPELRHINTASVAAYGTRNESVTLIVADDTQLSAIVQYLANIRAEPEMRTDRLVIDAWVKQSSISLTTLVTLDIGSRIQVTPMPAQAPTTTLDLFVEGMSDTFTTSGWQRSLNVSPVGTSGMVWELDSTDNSYLDLTTVLGV